MGQYIIPNAQSPREAADWLEAQGGVVTGQRWEKVEGGVLFTDTGKTDPQCAALYVSFVPAASSEESYRTPLPEAVRTHLQHLRDYVAKDPAQITSAESVHVIKDLIRAVHFLNSRLADEG